ncbi:hypothetical protein [Bradyrhizobium sp. dw_78]|uniref:hypothetical protein n=1 Tax=Bradyrhizobium sp. dw_78 TaxID=2719793 RepID=UPI001BD57E7F|nr:hypothetical protein [Bradyrhizobium sp. dw_78]
MIYIKANLPTPILFKLRSLHTIDGAESRERMATWILICATFNLSRDPILIEAVAISGMRRKNFSHFA